MSKFDGEYEFYELIDFLCKIGLDIKHKKYEEYLYGFNTKNTNFDFDTDEVVLIGFCTYNLRSYQCLSGNIVITNTKYKNYINYPHRVFSWGGEFMHPVILPIPCSNLQRGFIKDCIEFWGTDVAYDILKSGCREGFVRGYSYSNILK